MRRVGIGSLLLVWGMACAASAIAQRTTFEHKMISSPPNMPKVKVADPATKELLVGLHRGVAPAGLPAATGLTATEVERLITELEQEGLVRPNKEGKLKPTFPVITIREGEAAMAASSGVVTATADAIERRLPAIRKLTAQLEGFRHLKFEDASLFILSDVLLDAFQIGAVEKGYLRTGRPLRAGGNYYFALLEKSPDTLEAFGIYGNQVVPLSEGLGAGIYGNRRYDGPITFARLTATELERDFGFPAGIEPKAAKTELAKDLILRWRDPKAKIDPRHETGLTKLGLLAETGRPLIPVVTAPDMERLLELTRAFLPELLQILESHRSQLEQQYRQSSYDDEGVTFEEFFIWWYHVYYTGVTDELIRRKQITPPAQRNATYLMIN